MKPNNKEEDFYSVKIRMLLSILGASLLGNLLTGGKGIVRVGDGIVRAGEGSVVSRSKGEGSKKKKPKFTVTFSPINKYRNT